MAHNWTDSKVRFQGGLSEEYCPNCFRARLMRGSEVVGYQNDDAVTWEEFFSLENSEPPCEML